MGTLCKPPNPIRGVTFIRASAPTTSFLVDSQKLRLFILDSHSTTVLLKN